MTATARKLLSAFEALSPCDQHQVTVEILRRCTGADEFHNATLDELAAELLALPFLGASP